MSFFSLKESAGCVFESSEYCCCRTFDWVNKYTARVQLPPAVRLTGDKMEKNEMGGACNTHGGRESCVQAFGGET
jgi:hypothetical protein